MVLSVSDFAFEQWDQQSALPRGSMVRAISRGNHPHYDRETKRLIMSQLVLCSVCLQKFENF